MFPAPVIFFASRKMETKTPPLCPCSPPLIPKPQQNLRWPPLVRRSIFLRAAPMLPLVLSCSDRDGNPGWAFNTPHMSHGYIQSDGSIFTAV